MTPPPKARPALAVPAPPLSDAVVSLRTWRDDDVDALVVACQDPATQRFIPIPRPYRREDAVGYVARTARQWADGSKAAFAIVDATDPDVLWGAINIALSSTTGNTAYWIVPAVRGHGVAERALELLTGWAFGTLQLAVILLEIRPENEASQHVARAAGFHLAGRLDVNDVTGDRDSLIFARLAADPTPEPHHPNHP